MPEQASLCAKKGYIVLYSAKIDYIRGLNGRRQLITAYSILQAILEPTDCPISMYDVRQSTLQGC